MKKIVVASDSFKGTLSSTEIISLAKRAIHEVNPNIEVIGLPFADGGEGSVEAFSYFLNGKIIEIDSVDAFHRPIKGHYFFSEKTKTAIIETASSSKLNPYHLDVLNSSTYGTGLEILDAINKGAKEIFVTFGGSATNDGGLGAAYALGMKFYDSDGVDFLPLSKDLSRIINFDLTELKQKMNGIRFIGICDVTNVMFGPKGTAMIYSPQKGADTPLKVKTLDDGLKHLSELYEKKLNIDVSQIPGSGAAGAFASSIIALYDGELRSGIDTFLELSSFKEVIKEADYIITGEGKVDSQSLSGKVIDGIINAADQSSSKVIIVAGKIEEEMIPLLKKHPSFYEAYQTSLPNQSFAEIQKRAAQDYFNKIKEIAKHIQ